MKHFLLTSLFAAASFALVACDKTEEKTSDLEQRIQELEETRALDLKRKNELEQELASHHLAMEWAAIERERQEIEAKRKGLKLSDEEKKSLEQRDEKLGRREALAQEKHTKLVAERGFVRGGKKLPRDAEFPQAGLEVREFAESFNTPHATVDYQYFNNALSPYGTWYETNEYGSVWQPAACREPNWRPYTRGHWVCSDRGWTWISTEPFGWATYHYGRWALLENRGWIWVPGTEWAPNWCSWRYSDTFIGWAPLPPETLAFQNCAWDGRVELHYGIGASCYNFVRSLNFDRSIARYCLPVILNDDCLNETKNITRMKIYDGQIFCGGPGYRDLSKRLGRQLPYYKIHRNSSSYTHHNPAKLRSRVQGDRLIVAAPTVQKTHPIIAKTRLAGIKAERSKTADPQVLETYRKMRQRETQSFAQINPARPQPREALPPQKRVSHPRIAHTGSTVRSAPSKPSVTPTAEARKRKAEAQLEAFRKMARDQRAIASAERARRDLRNAKGKMQNEKITQQRLVALEAERQQTTNQQAQKEARTRQQLEEAQRNKRAEEERRWAADQRRQKEEIQRIKLIDEQRRQQLEQQRQRQEDAQRMQRQEQERQRMAEQQRQREEAQRQRIAEQKKQQEQAQRRQQEQAQRQAREEAQRRSQEEAQRRQRDEQQRRQRSR